MAECSVCREPALPGSAFCERHAPEIALPVFPATRDAAKTEVLRLEDLTPADAAATIAFKLPEIPAESDGAETHRALPRLVIPPAADAQATAMLRLPAVPNAVTDPAQPPVNPDAQATAMLRIPGLSSAITDPAQPPVSPDAQATAMLRLPSIPEASTDPSAAPVTAAPDPQATAVFRVETPEPETHRALPRLVMPTGPDAEATATFRPPPLATPVSFPDSQPTAMSAPVPTAPPPVVEDLVATSMARVPAPPAAPPTPAPAPRPKRQGNALGRVLGGRFEVKSHLGSGGFGATYVAWDTRLKRECVVKILRPLSEPPSPFEIELRKRFSNEALTMAHLTHPNITQVFDHGEEGDGANWIAMEYVRGRPLSDIGREEKQLEPLRAARLGAQIASALAFAHSRGIVHRDLKPDNILVVESQTGGEQVKVLDFGIARITDPSALGLDQSQAQLTNIGAFLGTPAYMSPEQASGAPVGPASDVYSLGVVLYLLITGRLPGTVPTAWNPLTTIAYVTSPFEPIRRLVPTCPPLVAETVEQMLVKEAHKRTLSAAQVDRELQSFAPTTYARAGAVPMPAQKRSILPVLSIGAVVVAIGAVVALQLTRKHADEVEAQAALAAKAAEPAPNVPDLKAIRESKIAGLLQKARAGALPAEIDAAADELAKAGPDARLHLAKGLAHAAAKDFDTALPLFQLAMDLGGSAPVAHEAEQQKSAALAAKAAAEAAAQRARESQAPHRKERAVQERPEY